MNKLAIHSFIQNTCPIDSVMQMCRFAFGHFIDNSFWIQLNIENDFEVLEKWELWKYTENPWI